MLIMLVFPDRPEKYLVNFQMAVWEQRREILQLRPVFFSLKYGRIVIAPISAWLIRSLLGKFVPVRRVFSKRGNPLAPVPPNIELMMKILSPDSKLLAKS